MNDLFIEFSFNKILEIFKHLEDFGFMLKKIDPCVSTIIINEGNIEGMIANGNRGRPPHI
jgi:hypothetical protein